MDKSTYRALKELGKRVLTSDEITAKYGDIVVYLVSDLRYIQAVKSAPIPPGSMPIHIGWKISQAGKDALATYRAGRNDRLITRGIAFMALAISLAALLLQWQQLLLKLGLSAS